jgi:hypothetical protein
MIIQELYRSKCCEIDLKKRELEIKLSSVNHEIAKKMERHTVLPSQFHVSSRKKIVYK